MTDFGLDARVSVIIPFLDPGAFLAEAVESVHAQTFNRLGTLACDDGSSDGSSDFAREQSRTYPGRVCYIDHPSHENRGLPASRNAGIASARGELVAFLDADDVWLPDKLASQVAILAERPSVGMACAPSQYWFSWQAAASDRPADFVPQMLQEYGLDADTVLDPPRMLLTAYPLGVASAPAPSSLMIRRGLLERIGGFDESFQGLYQLYEDQTLLTKIYLHAPVHVSGTWHDRHRRHTQSIESTVIGEGHYERVRKHFLEWLEGYFRSQGVIDPEIWEALDRALSSLAHD